MIDIDHERRDGPRIALSRPCKVYEPRSLKYVAGTTCDVGSGGMLLRLSRRLDVQPDDHVYVGVAQKRRHAILRSDEMIEAKVVRTLPLTSGEVALAVRFTEPAPDVALPLPLAA
jgi:hypothetical protein